MSEPGMRHGAAGEAVASGVGHRDQALKGIFLIIGSTLVLSSADIMVKFLAMSLPATQIVWLRFVAMAALMAPVLAMTGGMAMVRSRRPWLQILRGLGFAGSALLFVSGLQYLQLAEATAMSFIAPVFVTALSAIVLREKIGRRRWLAAIVGLAGVLIIVRPGTDAFQLVALLPLFSAVCWAATLIVTRIVGATDHAITTLAWSSWACVAATSLAVPFFFAPISVVQILIAMLIGLMSALAQYMIISAYRFADASLLAPFSYLLVIWSATGSFLVFGEIPGAWTFVGGLIIIASGLYTAHRERIRTQAAAGKGDA